jgi:GAF domain-containing protein
MPSASVAFYLIEHESGTLHARFTAGAGAQTIANTTIPVAERLSGWVAASGEPIVNSEAALDLPGLPDAGLRYAAALPLQAADGALVGVLTLYLTHPLRDDQISHLQLVAPHMGQAIAAALSARGAHPALAATAEMRRRSGIRVVAAAR